MKINAKTGVLLFIAFIFILALLNLLTPARAFSENENRYLAQVPAFSAGALARGEYTAGLDTYIIDQFAWRDGWVGMKAALEQGVGKKASNGVYFAGDGYLIEQFDTIDRDRYARNLAFVAEFSAKVWQEAGVEVKTMLVPTASHILGDKLPAFAPEVDQQALLAQAADTLPGLVDISGSLEAHRDQPIYYRTDHHWTSLGAYYGYCAWRQATGETPPPASAFQVRPLSSEFYGTTWSKASLYSARPDTIEAWEPADALVTGVTYNEGTPDETREASLYQLSFLEGKDKYSVFLNANQAISRIATDRANGRRLLVVKDSYANTFVQFAPGDYEEIVVLDPRYYRASYARFVAENNITDVLVLYNLKGFAADTNLYFLTT